MIVTDTAAGSDGVLVENGSVARFLGERNRAGRKTRMSWFMLWLCLTLACVGTSWFAYQYFLVAQPRSFTPDWKASQWIQATDGTAAVAYFRYATQIDTVPDGAFVTIAANQTFRLFVNTTFIGTNESDFLQGDALRPYMYDVASALQRGPNSIVIRAANLDQHTPAIRADLHVIVGTASQDYGTSSQWKATVKSSLVYPRSATNLYAWGDVNFDTSAWPLAQLANPVSALSTITVNPRLYEQPLPKQWISEGAGTQAYFERQLSLTQSISDYWIRFAAAGPASIFVNGNLLVLWTGKPPVDIRNIVGSLGYLGIRVQIRKNPIVGVYNIAPYLHTGTNTIAVYLSAPDVAGLLNHVGASMSMDMLISDTLGHDSWDESTTGWHVSSRFTNGWEQGNSAMQAWPAPTSIASPQAYQQFYMLDSSALLLRDKSLRSTQMTSLSLVLEVILWSITAVFGVWLLMAYTLGRRYYGDMRNALMVISTAYLPALACEIVFATLMRESRLPFPFPYNLQGGLFLLGLVIAAYLLLWFHGRWQKKVGGRQQRVELAGRSRGIRSSVYRYEPSTHVILPRIMLPFSSGFSSTLAVTAVPVANNRLLMQIRRLLTYSMSWLRLHWAVLPLILIGGLLVFSTLTYEPYWQDELVSYYVAKNSIIHGFPMMPSGFIYPKAELYEYMLGLCMLIFGDHGVGPRLLSAVEFLLSIPLLYFVGSYFFGRRVGWFAAAMLALSPFALVWGAQVRMYEQAQVCVLFVFYIFYKAARSPKNVRLAYSAVACLVITYLSHEETFVILPGLVLCVFMISKDRRRLLPAVFYQKHWWFAALVGASIIGLQLLVVRYSHPPVLGTDQSMRPNVQLNESGLPFYIRLLFSPKSTNSWLTINSILATLGCLWALCTKNKRLRYCVLFLTIALVMLAFVFTMEADRYFYPLLPIYYLIGAYIALKMLKLVWLFVRLHIVPLGWRGESRARGRISQPLRWMAVLTASLVCGSVLLAPMLPISNYNLGVSRLFGLSYYRHFADYDLTGQYVKQHWQSGDIVISISPDIEAYYYTGHSDYYFSTDRSLFLLERNGNIINTSTAALALLSQSDFQAILAKHTRIWLISDHNQYEAGILKRFTFPADFHIAYEGARNIVYLRES